MDLTVPVVAKFINGEKVGEQTLSAGKDGRWSLFPSTDANTPYALLFADEDGEDALAYVNSIQFWSGRLSDATLVALGTPTAEGLPLPSNPITIKATRTGTTITIEWTGGTAPYQLQKTTSLTSPSWQNVGSAVSGNSTTDAIGTGSAFYRVSGK